MKKLSLKDLKLGEDELLQREQLKTVFGGYGGSTGSCAYESNLGLIIDASRETAQEKTTGRWCCDSCCQASWAQNYGC